MNPTAQRDELLRSILKQTDSGSAADVSAHLDDDTLALFAERALSSPQQSIANEHLATCAECRKLVTCMLADEAVASNSTTAVRSVPLLAPSNVSPPSKTRSMSGMFATIAAATILLAVSLWFAAPTDQNLNARRAQRKYRQAEQLLAQADFDGARSVLSAARQQGVRSDFLISLESQAIRHLPGTLALASAGRLTDFGYDVDGTVARGSTPRTGLNDARQLLDTVRSEETEVLLNRGHVALSAGEAVSAIPDFQVVTNRDPENIWGWLGLGLAQFVERDLTAAETAFRRCLEIDPQSITAHINLAMTLQEQDRVEEATRIWQSLLDSPLIESLSEKDRALVHRALAALKQE